MVWESTIDPSFLSLVVRLFVHVLSWIDLFFSRTKGLPLNYHAIANDDPVVSLTLVGRPYEQPVFKYQAKCFARLKSLWADADTPELRDVLSETGCLRHLA